MRKMDLETRIQRYKDLRHENRYELEEYILKDGKRHPIAIVCPGGGYETVCSFVEGIPFVRKLNRMGISAVIVRYRTKDFARYPNPQDDLACAVEYLCDHADELNIDMEHYSVWGSSAGGHLVASFGTESMGYAKYGLPKPGTLVLIYPVITMGDLTHAGTKRNLLGPDPSPEAVDAASVEKQVTENYPPTFVWCGDADKAVPMENSAMLAAALTEKGVPHEHVVYEGIEHGVGLAQGTVAENWFHQALVFWKGMTID